MTTAPAASHDGAGTLSMDAVFDILFGKPKPKRKKVSLQQQLTPCLWCEYPISQQHHLFAVHKYGANDDTLPLCANCHQLFHIVYDAYVLKKRAASVKFQQIVAVFGVEDPVIGCACQTVQILYHAEQGDLKEWAEENGVSLPSINEPGGG